MERRDRLIADDQRRFQRERACWPRPSRLWRSHRPTTAAITATPWPSGLSPATPHPHRPGSPSPALQWARPQETPPSSVRNEGVESASPGRSRMGTRGRHGGGYRRPCPPFSPRSRPQPLRSTRRAPGADCVPPNNGDPERLHRHVTPALWQGCTAITGNGVGPSIRR